VRIEIPLVTEHAVVALPGEVVFREWISLRERVTKTLTGPVYLELRIDAHGLEAMAKRAILSKGKQCTDGPFQLKIRRGSVVEYDTTHEPRKDA
jgi:hypothetical protein